MSYGICFLPVVPLRATASHRSEMVSQILFGESFEIQEVKQGWAFIRLSHDQYEGWVEQKQCVEVSEHFFQDLLASKQVVTGLSSHSVCLKLGLEEILNVLPGSTLPFLDDTTFTVAEQDYLFLGESSIPDPAEFYARLEETAQFYLNAPYLWGGRSMFGIDCSGFVQLVYKHLGVQILRDAAQQVKQGRAVDFLQDAKAGDLAFFENEEGKITHVGLLLEDEEIIHASGHVKIDKIDEKGIFCRSTQTYTHCLKSIRRIVE